MVRDAVLTAFMIMAAVLAPHSSRAAVQSAPPPIESRPASPGPVKRVATCRLTGRVICSEYGTRYKEPLTLVFESADARYRADISNNDGGFSAMLPCNGSFTMRMEFGGNGFMVGPLDMPQGLAEGSAVTVEMRYGGSMLELVRDARAGSGEGTVAVKVLER